jgi:hypothetical protein
VNGICQGCLELQCQCDEIEGRWIPRGLELNEVALRFDRERTRVEEIVTTMPLHVTNFFDHQDAILAAFRRFQFGRGS